MKSSIVGLAAVLQLAVHTSAQDGQSSPSDLENYWSYGRSESVPDTRKFQFLLIVLIGSNIDSVFKQPLQKDWGIGSMPIPKPGSSFPR